MKHILRILTLFLGILMLSAVSAFAQDPGPFEPGTTVGQVFNWYTLVYGSVVSLLTYLQAAIKWPFLAKVKTSVKYIVIAGVVGLLFYSLGWLDALGIVIGFIGTALTYDKVLSPIGLKTANNT